MKTQSDIFGSDTVVKVPRDFWKLQTFGTSNHVWFVQFEKSNSGGEYDFTRDQQRGKYLTKILENRIGYTLDYGRV